MGNFNFGKSKTIKKHGLSRSAAKEAAGIQVARSQIVRLGIPYQTPRAAEIRTAVNTKVLTDDGRRIFFFRGEDESWTNVDLKATDAEPLLTAGPIEATEKAYNVLSHCPAVSTVSIEDEDGSPLTMAQVRSSPTRVCALRHPELTTCVVDQGHGLHPTRRASRERGRR